MISPLRLHLHIPLKDVRRLIWRHIDEADREMVRCAQNSKRTVQMNRTDLVLNCCVYGYLERLQWAFPGATLARFLNALDDDSLRVAAEWFHTAAYNDHLPVVLWLFSLVNSPTQRGIWLSQVLRGAARGGSVSIVRWCYFEKGCSAAEMRSEIIMGGDLELFKWMWTLLKDVGWRLENIVSDVVMHGHTHIVEWLCDAHGNDIVFTQRHCQFAIYGANLELLMCLVKRGAPWDPTYYEEEARFVYRNDNLSLEADRDKAFRVLDWIIEEKIKRGD